MPFDFSLPQWQAFHLKSPQDRAQIAQFPPNSSIPPAIENQIGIFSLPIGLSLNLLVNGKAYAVPMVTEEASVVAASCNANKIIATCGDPPGFQTPSPPPPRNITLGQLYIEGQNLNVVLEQRSRIKKIANSQCPRMCQRGGGVVRVRAKALSSQSQAVIVTLYVDVCEAMGANFVNSLLTRVKEILQREWNWKVPFAIVSNAAEPRIVRSQFRLSLSKWSQSKGIAAREVAERIVQLNEWAKADSHRACTHNKGIFNGIEAVAVALGQDTRAINAAGYFHALKKHNYRPFTDYWIESGGEGEGEFLCGKIEIPLPLGTVGGALMNSESAPKRHLDWMGIRGGGEEGGVAELSGVIASLGLGQNFAALRAIACEGIQVGHMALHFENVDFGLNKEEQKRILLAELKKRKIWQIEEAFSLAREMFGCPANKEY